MTPRILCIAIGNPLRGDDGAGRRVLELLGSLPDVDFLCLRQLTPELARSIADARHVIFIDADLRPGIARIEPVLRAEKSGAAISHTLTAAAIVELAQNLFGFRGCAFVCHVPGISFDAREGLSAVVERNAHRASELIRAFYTDLP